MSNPLVHAERAAKRWGGLAADYLPLHQWFDATKGHVPDNRHRMVLHNAFGILLAEQVFGSTIVNSSGRRVFVRDLGVHHVLEDLGFVPTLADCLIDLPLLPWMAGHRHLRPARISDNTGIPLIGATCEDRGSQTFDRPEQSGR